MGGFWRLPFWHRSLSLTRDRARIRREPQPYSPHTLKVWLKLLCKKATGQRSWCRDNGVGPREAADMKRIMANSALWNRPITNFPRAKRPFFCEAYNNDVGSPIKRLWIFGFQTTPPLADSSTASVLQALNYPNPESSTLRSHESLEASDLFLDPITPLLLTRAACKRGKQFSRPARAFLFSHGPSQGLSLSFRLILIFPFQSPVPWLF